MIEGSYFYVDGNNFKLKILTDGKVLEYKLSRPRLLFHIQNAVEALRKSEMDRVD